MTSLTQIQREFPAKTDILRRRYSLPAILLLAMLLRVAVALYLGDSVPPAKDEFSYSALAARLAGGYGYSFPTGWYPFTPAETPTAHWSFLYTAFVAGLYRLFGEHPLVARLAGALLGGLLLPWLTYRLALRMKGQRRRVQGLWYIPSVADQRIALVAAGSAAIYAYFVLYSAMVQTEALFIAALLWSLERSLALVDALKMPPTQGTRHLLWVAGSLGLSLGTATLLRQSILPWIPLLFLFLLWASLGFRREKQAILALCVAGSLLLLAILPFTLRNYRVYDSFLLLNSNAGYAMYAAQHPLHGVDFQAYVAAPLPEELVGQVLNEAQWDKELMKRGIGFILADPLRYLRLSLSRVADYFEFWPTTDSSLLFNLGRVGSFGLFLPFMLYGIYREVADRQRHCTLFAQALTLLFVLAYSLLHIFTWAMSRYRLPVDAVLLIYAAVAIVHLWDNRLRWARMPGSQPDP